MIENQFEIFDLLLQLAVTVGALLVVALVTFRIVAGVLILAERTADTRPARRGVHGSADPPLADPPALIAKHLI